MEFDENKKIEVEVSENEFVEYATKRKPLSKLMSKLKGADVDAYDMAFVPLLLGVTVSLGFLVANVAKLSIAAGSVGAFVQALFG